MKPSIDVFAVKEDAENLKDAWTTKEQHCVARKSGFSSCPAVHLYSKTGHVTSLCALPQLTKKEEGIIA